MREMAQVRAIPADACKLTDFREAEKIGHGEFAASVLVRPVAMQPIPAAPRLQID